MPRGLCRSETTLRKRSLLLLEALQLFWPVSPHAAILLVLAILSLFRDADFPDHINARHIPGPECLYLAQLADDLLCFVTLDLLIDPPLIPDGRTWASAVGQDQQHKGTYFG
jgi:hypothetical protein